MTTLALKTIDRQKLSTSMRLPIKATATTVELQAVADAIDGVILGADVKASKTETTVIDAGSLVPPDNKSANRGNKWQIMMQDTVNSKTFDYEIGTADDALLPSADSDFLDITTDPSPGKTLKDTIEAVYESPYGHPGIVLSIQQVNRKTNP